MSRGQGGLTSTLPVESLCNGGLFVLVLLLHEGGLLSQPLLYLSLYLKQLSFCFRATLLMMTVESAQHPRLDSPHNREGYTVVDSVF